MQIHSPKGVFKGVFRKMGGYPKGVLTRADHQTREQIIPWEATFAVKLLRKKRETLVKASL